MSGKQRKFGNAVRKVTTVKEAMDAIEEIGYVIMPDGSHRPAVLVRKEVSDCVKALKKI